MGNGCVEEEQECIFFFFFKQKTAYEIYQCDWSSDVCSSDLSQGAIFCQPIVNPKINTTKTIIPRISKIIVFVLIDRKSVVQGKSVDLGGRRIIKKKKKQHCSISYKKY